MRPLTLAFLAALFSSATPSIAANLIAPRPQITLPSSSSFDADGASNGTSTLVVWRSKIFDIYDGGLSARLLSASNPNATSLPISWRASSTAVATNGSDYLVGFGFPLTRDATNFGSVGLRRVDADGSMGGLKPIATSIPWGYIGDIAWDGTHWIVGFSDGSARVAILDDTLELAAPLLTFGPGSAPTIELIGGRWWAIYTDTQGQLGRVVEITGSGSQGASYELPSIADLRLASLGDGAIAASLTAQNPRHIEFRRFDPLSGFSAITDRGEGTFLVDFEPWRGATLLVTADAASGLRLSQIDSSGTTERSVRVMASDASIIDSASGAALLYTRPSGITQLGAIFIGSVSEILSEGAGGEVVSLNDIGRQTAPILGSTGSSLVAFWLQNGGASAGLSLHTRVLNASGAPAGPIVVLPLEDTIISAVIFQGSSFILAGVRQNQVVAMTMTADGRSLGSLQVLGTGQVPQLAHTGGQTLAVWNDGGTLRATPLRTDATAEIPGGFEILPSLRNDQGAFALHDLQDGFQIVVGGTVVHSLTLTPGGNIRTLTVLSNDNATDIVADSDESSGLAIWVESGKPTLFAFGPDGHPFERFDPLWGDSWTPASILALGEGRYLVTFWRSERAYVADVTMQGAFVTDVSSPRQLGVTTLSPTPMAAINGETVIAYQTSAGVWTARIDQITEPRRRAARR